MKKIISPLFRIAIPYLAILLVIGVGTAMAATTSKKIHFDLEGTASNWAYTNPAREALVTGELDGTILSSGAKSRFGNLKGSLTMGGEKKAMTLKPGPAIDVNYADDGWGCSTNCHEVMVPVQVSLSGGPTTFTTWSNSDYWSGSDYWSNSDTVTEKNSRTAGAGMLSFVNWSNVETGNSGSYMNLYATVVSKSRAWNISLRGRESGGDEAGPAALSTPAASNSKNAKK